MKYYSPSQNAFYDDAVHGPRTISVIDEEKQAHALAALTEREGEPDADQSAIDQARAAFVASPITVEITNPECRLPEDAIPIDDKTHFDLMAKQAEGWEIMPDAMGFPVAGVPVPAATTALSTARASRDRALAASDWTQLPDTLTAAKRKLWAEHRQALRELPARIEEAIGKGMSPTEAAALVTANIAATRPE